MSRDLGRERRGVAPVIAVTILVAFAVVLATTVSAFVLVDNPDLPPPAPQISVSHQLVSDGDERTIAVTLEGGNAVDTDQLYVTGSKPLDIGGAPGSGTPADETYASDRENFVEAAGDNPPQVGIGEQWESGETIYLDPEGTAEGVTISIYWNTEPIEGGNPGTVTGDDANLIAEFRV
ncbi:type IV pilin [Haloplanus aerogenes]|uniref:Flagellin-like protein n=1 Tax=Haloplanus aerogenes TaxID=660522 RepID=A0A3M0CY32_9EURY|nr:type IV pilin N-terminal domain-containing protein [Haloplanus aerogenes]RMB13784.1 flagellin-like protein [Haloplanus aerogenes]